MSTHDYTNFRVPVPLEFENVFTHFYFAENSYNQVITKTLLPSFQTILIFSFGAKVSLHLGEEKEILVDKCMVLGPIKRSFLYQLEVGGQILVANFKNDAFYRFFGQASINFSNPDELLDENCFTNLWSMINQLESVYEKVNLILDFCRPYLKMSSPTSDLLANFENEEQSPIKAIAQQVNQTERTLQNHHKKYFGYSAKEKNRYLRFLKVINHLQTNTESINWFDIIATFGYYDQSQLIHDFKHYLNISPKQYLKFQQDICKATP